MFEIIKSSSFERRFLNLKDRGTKARIQVRVDRLALGNPGDTKIVRDGIHEMRVDCGPGYRVYYIHKGLMVIVLLVGGDKSSQDSDIERAISLANNWQEVKNVRNIFTLG